jgi:UDP-2,4-diacetamido-2,4,6-trideoxy-beta-L-altropyranose hydrolase
MPASNPRIAFRAAASPAIGGGHVARSLSLADALAASGASCTIFANAQAVASAPLLARSGHALVAVPREAGEAVALARSHGAFDWLVVDDYSLSARDETPWRQVAAKILVVDDLADRAHDCDLLLDSGPQRQAADYAGLTPPDARLLLGPAYAPLRREFALARPAALARREQTDSPSRLLVSFGLTDPGGITAQAAEAIAAALPELALDVVLGPLSQSRGRIERLGRANITLHIDPPSMPALMTRADIALGAGGSTAWERACLGLPSVALILADNQRDLARGLEARGALTAFESHPAIWDDVVSSLKAMTGSRQDWRAMSFKAALACDGLGASRVALELTPVTSRQGAQVRLRPAGWHDMERLLVWQTAPGAREFSSNPERPTREGHEIWMARKLEEPGCVFSIIEEAGTAVGVLRLDQRRDGSFIVSILVADHARGHGVGLAALQAGARLVPGRLWAKIDPRNAASLRMFAKAGFVHQGHELYRHESGA